MFKVRSLRSGEVRTVFAVVGPLFMFWKDGAWTYEESKYYIPEEVKE